MAQMKEWNKTLEKEITKMEVNNLSDTEFKTLVIRMLKRLSKNFSEEIVNIKKGIGTIKISFIHEEYSN